LGGNGAATEIIVQLVPGGSSHPGAKAHAAVVFTIIVQPARNRSKAFLHQIIA
jgi:hypothetical protein